MGQVRIKWLHAPGHAGSIGEKVIQYAKDTNALIIDWSEMYWNVDDLRKHGAGYDHFIGDSVRKDRRGRVVNHDVIISTREDAKVIGDYSFKISPEIRRFLKYMPARYAKARLIEYKGQTLLIIAWHPHPNPFRRVKLVLPYYRRSVAVVEDMQRALIREHNPDLVLNGGDLQLGVGKDRVYPNKIASRLGMQWRRHSIDWQMWRGTGYRFKKFYTKNPSKVSKGIDHLWTVLVLKKHL